MIIAVLGYWTLFYQPKSKEIAAISTKVQDFDINIKEEEAKVKARGYEEEIAKNQQEVSRLQDKFPSQNELPGLFQELFNIANKFHIEIVSIEPGTPEVYKSKNQAESDLVFNKVPIKLKLQSTYKDLSEFLRALFENPQYAFTFDDLEMARLKDMPPMLDVDLLLGAFVLSHEGAASIEQEVQKGLDFNFKGKK
jgi:Tfp pilus assembly protein PilO